MYHDCHQSNKNCNYEGSKHMNTKTTKFMAEVTSHWQVRRPTFVHLLQVQAAQLPLHLSDS